MKKFTVHMCTPILTWDDVEAETEAEAIAKCVPPPYFDGNEEPVAWITEDVAPDDEEEENEE